MDAVENLGLLEQIERQKLHREEEYIRNREKLIAWFKEHIAVGRIRLALANIDFERNGTTANEAVLQYERADCDPANESNFAGLAGRAFYVLDPEKVQIDVEKSKSISFYDRADIFLFKERVYLTHWGEILASGTEPCPLPPLCTQLIIAHAVIIATKPIQAGGTHDFESPSYRNAISIRATTI